MTVMLSQSLEISGTHCSNAAFVLSKVKNVCSL